MLPTTDVLAARYLRVSDPTSVNSSQEYYSRLSEDYDVTIRQLVPHYDEMTGALVRLVASEAPSHVLDIGIGVGNVTAQLLAAAPGAWVTGVERSPAMAAAVRERLPPSRVSVYEGGISEFAPPGSFDAVMSNLVLHNLLDDDKTRLLGRLRSWLRPGGVFVWGDFVAHEDPTHSEAVVQERIAFARGSGCPDDLIEWNFRKEREEDHPWPVPRMLEGLRAAGFALVDCAWAVGAFAIVIGRP